VSRSKTKKPSGNEAGPPIIASYLWVYNGHDAGPIGFGGGWLTDSHDQWNDANTIMETNIFNKPIKANIQFDKPISDQAIFSATLELQNIGYLYIFH
jgi:hypothetical protein